MEDIGSLALLINRMNDGTIRLHSKRHKDISFDEIYAKNTESIDIFGWIKICISLKKHNFLGYILAEEAKKEVPHTKATKNKHSQEEKNRYYTRRSVLIKAVLICIEYKNYFALKKILWYMCKYNYKLGAKNNDDEYFRKEDLTTIITDRKALEIIMRHVKNLFYPKLLSIFMMKIFEYKWDNTSIRFVKYIAGMNFSYIHEHLQEEIFPSGNLRMYERKLYIKSLVKTQYNTIYGWTHKPALERGNSTDLIRGANVVLLAHHKDIFFVVKRLIAVQKYMPEVICQNVIREIIKEPFANNIIALMTRENNAMYGYALQAKYWHKWTWFIVGQRERKKNNLKDIIYSFPGMQVFIAYKGEQKDVEIRNVYIHGYYYEALRKKLCKE